MALCLQPLVTGSAWGLGAGHATGPAASPSAVPDPDPTLLSMTSCSVSQTRVPHADVARHLLGEDALAAWCHCLSQGSGLGRLSDLTLKGVQVWTAHPDGETRVTFQQSARVWPPPAIPPRRDCRGAGGHPWPALQCPEPMQQHLRVPIPRDKMGLPPVQGALATPTWDCLLSQLAAGLSSLGQRRRQEALTAGAHAGTPMLWALGVRPSRR